MTFSLTFGVRVMAARRCMPSFKLRFPGNYLVASFIDTVPGNKASEALLLNVGFKEEGLRRESGYWKNQFHDLKCFGLIKSEYLCN